ncbi:imidazole glycerol phosphate synthase subunit HisH [Undibacterium luofuense]|uniref:Imidazole glycerol phosphate synthase subunit HisH n=1 Tax=Undibacterium luofuense TaxID=2828733 RepID=A0A941DQY0_9BURK|nr:imidazole glycerol phosphate synthase subunit HisH [Undibacterium luofuense]MBR7784204.1 imidazole glycerol phosphate synthase subunit HisH [Undibacterium luofuense]
MIKIIDYGLGNILAFQNIYKRLNIPVALAKTIDDLKGATRLILPGVGAFDHAMEELGRSGMRARLDELVLGEKMPVLGICVGMQMMAEGSEEGNLPGLGWIPGYVKGFKGLNQPNLLLPHMGWNDVQPVTGHPLFNDLATNGLFYFLHSFYFECADPVHVAAISSYGKEFSCAISAGHIHGVQFHPEKSHHFGAQLLKNFAEI